MRRNLAGVFLSLFLICCSSVLAQSPNGSITGIVFDPDTKSIPGAEIIAVNDLTGVKYVTSTNGEGIYSIQNLPPGPYRIQVSKSGFKSIIKPDIILSVQDALSINFTLPIGASSVVVTVEGGAPLINTQSAAVSTVVDRNFVENMPLNGRSFQDLILLSPGVVTNSPQSTAFTGYSGEFSVNGQRTESNYYSVDGVSANIGVAPGYAENPSAGGSLPASTALGTTQGLVSVDALQEFRVQTSSYSAEQGRNPGGQFSFVTRSGTNQWHGTAFEYLRNNMFDANDWFNNYFSQPQPPLRQNDFGGTLGGPVLLPHVYDGKDKTFFFFSYEGLRLVQPQAASITDVPDAGLRQSTPAPLQAVMNAFPVANGPDLGGGLAEFIGAWSNPSQIDATSIRFDHEVNDRLRLFFRFANASSNSASRFASTLNSNAYGTRTYTFGVNQVFGNRVANEFRLNYSSNDAITSTKITSFDGASAIDTVKLQGLDPSQLPTYSINFYLFFSGYFGQLYEQRERGLQRQWNLTDVASFQMGRHQLRTGVDYRRLFPIQQNADPYIVYEYFDETSVQANSADAAVGEAFGKAYPVYTNFSAFGQDEWRVTPRLNLSMGLRWEVNPAPGAAKGNLPYTVEGSSLSTLELAPQGSPLWKTAWYNFAPRLGIAYVLRNSQAFETVLRGGAGVFFDTGQQLGSYGYYGPGFRSFDVSSGTAFPLPLQQAVPTIVNPPVAPYANTVVYAFPLHLQLPYTLQWNVALEQALGNSQALTVSYVGSNARRLLGWDSVQPGSLNPNFPDGILFTVNGLTADYNALQVQYQRRLSRGLQALASYTWSHSIDYGSNNTDLPYVRGNSSFDVRQNFSTAVTYEMPDHLQNAVARATLSHWSVDTRFMARTGFPVTLQGPLTLDPATGQSTYAGLNLVPGVPPYVYGPQYPGGRAINVNAFSLPPGCTPSVCATPESGDAPRNSMRGFGAWQMDLAVRREFPLYERFKLQLRADGFNILNHANFGAINPTYCAPGPFCTFGQATQTLAQSLGTLSPLYQMGGPRSLQFSLKLMF